MISLTAKLFKPLSSHPTNFLNFRFTPCSLVAGVTWLQLFSHLCSSVLKPHFNLFLCHAHFTRYPKSIFESNVFLFGEYPLQCLQLIGCVRGSSVTLRYCDRSGGQVVLKFPSSRRNRRCGSKFIWKLVMNVIGRRRIVDGIGRDRGMLESQRCEKTCSLVKHTGAWWAWKNVQKIGRRIAWTYRQMREEIAAD